LVSSRTTSTRPVSGDDDAVAILDESARRRHEAEVELVLGRQGGELPGLDHLQLAQSQSETHHAEGRQPADDERAAQERALSLVRVAEEDGGLGTHL
jgi:hypothetical protein